VRVLDLDVQVLAEGLDEPIEASLRSSEAEGTAYWDVFVDAVEEILSALESGLPW
jgi:hypothetical protein